MLNLDACYFLLPLSDILNEFDLYDDLFRDLGEVREATYWWMIEYNEQRPHDSLDDLTPVEYFSKNAGNSIFQLSA
jgi:putative transposase